MFLFASHEWLVVCRKRQKRRTWTTAACTTSRARRYRVSPDNRPPSRLVPSLFFLASPWRVRRFFFVHGSELCARHTNSALLHVLRVVCVFACLTHARPHEATIPQHTHAHLLRFRFCDVQSRTSCSTSWARALNDKRTSPFTSVPHSFPPPPPVRTRTLPRGMDPEVTIIGCVLYVSVCRPRSGRTDRPHRRPGSRGAIHTDPVRSPDENDPPRPDHGSTFDVSSSFLSFVLFRSFHLCGRVAVCQRRRWPSARLTRSRRPAACGRSSSPSSWSSSASSPSPSSCPDIASPTLPIIIATTNVLYSSILHHTCSCCTPFPPHPPPTMTW